MPCLTSHQNPENLVKHKQLVLRRKGFFPVGFLYNVWGPLLRSPEKWLTVLSVPGNEAACLNACAWLPIPPFEGTFETSKSEYSKNEGGREQNWPCGTLSQKMTKLLRPLLARCYEGRSKESNKEHRYARECSRG